jgi:hypothetical protein
MKAMGAFLGLLVSMPIWFFLIYEILTSVNAGELAWFLYYAYIPSTFIGACLIHIGKG